MGKADPHYIDEYLVTLKDEPVARINRAGQITNVLKLTFANELNHIIRRAQQGY